MTPVVLSQAYRAAREGAGLIARRRGLIIVTGRERSSYLQGLLTNDIAALGAGEGCYSAYLTAQGRMITDLFVYELGDAILLTLPPATKDTVLAKLDQFIFSEDVQLGDVSATFAAITLVGPEASAVLARALTTDTESTADGETLQRLDALPMHGNRRIDRDGQTVIVLRTQDAGEQGFEIVAPADAVSALIDRLHAGGAEDVDDATADVLRVEGGIALFGRDMDEETIPLEAGIEQSAISFTKGCYVGQEVIIRVLHRGHGRVARRLVGLVFDGRERPEAGAALHADGKEVGSITSTVDSPALGRPIALAYVKRDVANPGTKVTTAAGLAADVVTLPFASA